MIAVLRNQLWAYPTMIALLVAFIAYQTYRLQVRFTIGLDGIAVSSIGELRRLLDHTRIERLCSVRVVRGGKLRHAVITLREHPPK